MQFIHVISDLDLDLHQDNLLSHLTSGFVSVQQMQVTIIHKIITIPVIITTIAVIVIIYTLGHDPHS